MKLKLFICFYIILLCCSSCHVARYFMWNFADTNDHKKFQNVEVKAPSHASVFYENNEDRRIILPQINNKKGISFEEALKKNKTVAFLIIKNDSILYEKYFDGYNKTTIHPSFSVVKSFVSALVGIAIDEGKIKSVHDPITNYLPELISNEFKKITIKHLLDMRSGIAFNEGYFNPFGDVAKYYYGRNLNKYLLNIKIERPPGEKWQYKSVNTQLLGKIIERATNQPLNEYLQEKIWIPLGMEQDASWSIDSKKNHTIKAFSSLNACTRDFAKLGQLYLNKGRWNNEQIISENWIDETVEFDTYMNYFMYKNHWWHTPSGEEISDSTIYPKVYKKGFDNVNGEKSNMIFYASGNYRAEGILGQYIFVSPKKNMVIVRLGSNYGNLDWVILFDKIVKLN